MHEPNPPLGTKLTHVGQELSEQRPVSTSEPGSDRCLTGISGLCVDQFYLPPKCRVRLGRGKELYDPHAVAGPGKHVEPFLVTVPIVEVADDHHQAARLPAAGKLGGRTGQIGGRRLGGGPIGQEPQQPARLSRIGLHGRRPIANQPRAEGGQPQRLFHPQRCGDQQGRHVPGHIDLGKIAQGHAPRAVQQGVAARLGMGQSKASQQLVAPRTNRPVDRAVVVAGRIIAAIAPRPPLGGPPPGGRRLMGAFQREKVEVHLSSVSCQLSVASCQWLVFRS